jgi:hypothetical protein
LRVVRSARSLYRVGVAYAVGAVLALGLAAAAALPFLAFNAPPAQLLAACRRFLLPHLSVPGVLALALMGLGLAVLMLGIRSVARQLRERRRTLAAASGAHPLGNEMPGVLAFDHPRPLAFCAGLARPRVYVSSGALAALDREQLLAVVAHERHHARRRDPLRIFIVRTLADALFFLPGLRRLGSRYAALAELAADEAAVRAAGDAAPLASALLAFGDAPALGVVGIAPERVDHLMGDAPRWQLPVSLMLAGLLVAAALGALAIGLVMAAPGSPVSVPLVAARSCMVAMAAAGLGFAVAGGLAVHRRRRSAQP